MQRIIVLLGIACLLVGCAGGIWLAFQPPVHPPFPADRIERRVGIGEWEWTLDYQVQAPLDRWYVPITQQLEAEGWTRRSTGYAGRPLPLLDPVAYERRLSLGLVVLWERVEMDGDLRGRHVRIRRWLTSRALSSNQL